MNQKTVLVICFEAKRGGNIVFIEGLAVPLKYQEDPKDHKIKPVSIPPQDNA